MQHISSMIYQCILLSISELGKHTWIYWILWWIKMISHIEHCSCRLAWAMGMLLELQLQQVLIEPKIWNASNFSLKLLQASIGEAGSEIGSNLIRGAMEELSLLSACTPWRTGKWCRVHLANMHPVKKWPPRDVGALRHVKCSLLCSLRCSLKCQSIDIYFPIYRTR